MLFSSDVAQENTGPLEKQPTTESPTMGRFILGASTILVAFKGIGCSRRPLLWNRQASIVLDLVLTVCVFAACDGDVSAQSQYESSTGSASYAKGIMSPGGAKAPPEVIGELTPPLKSWTDYYRHWHPRETFQKVNHYGYVRPTPAAPSAPAQSRFSLVTGPSLVGQDAALSGESGRYLWRRGIITTIFWIGERPRGNNPVPNFRSSWDKYWYYSYGGYDNPDPGSRRNFIPINFVPRQNPFYFALPYDDVEGGHTKYEASRVIPWFKQAFDRDGQTVLKDRWIAVRHGNKVCYAQWEDCGPFRTDDWRYVFGNESPRPNLNQGAGLDVSPAVRDYLGLGTKDACDWKFVEFREVPPGPWARYGDNNTFVILRRRNNERFATK